MNEKITLEDYKQVSEEFFPKYFYVADQLGENAKPDDVLKIMESLSGLVLKNRAEENKPTLGFARGNGKQDPNDTPMGETVIGQKQ
tara:strand:+ start:339 stop:596 length:258 start_codon:yes stop_codon:yes gene_type:complete